MSDNGTEKKKKYSELTLEDKEYETMDMIHTFSKDIIPQIDKAIGGKRPPIIKAPFLDLLVESYFSIQSFCVLVKEGLISSAAAILRITLEQISIIKLLVKYPLARKSFEGIKLFKQIYHASKDDDRKKFTDCLKNMGVNKNRINQYFDYGWNKFADCNELSLKSICKSAETYHVYEMVNSFLNQFSHGQLSIFQFRRAKNKADLKLISSMQQHLFQLFTFLVNATVKEFGESVITKENKQLFTLVRSLIFDTRLRISEIQCQQQMILKNKAPYKIANLKDVCIQIASLLDITEDSRELYFLSQAYVRDVRIIVAIYIYNNASNITNTDFSNFNLLNLYKKYSPYFMGYERPDVLKIETLFEMIDSFNDDCSFSGHFLDYSLAYSVDVLLSLL